MGFIGAVSNYKGGVGKTIFTINIATALANKNKKVLIVDNDPQSDSTRAVLPRDTRIEGCLYHLINPDQTEKVDIRDCIYRTIHDNLFILPNITETSGLEIPLAQNFPASNLYLRNAIRDYCKENYDYVFIDCPPTLGLFVNNALCAADFVMIPMDSGSGNSLEGIKGVLDLMSSVKEQDNKDLSFLKILINKIDKRKNSHKAIVNDVFNRYGKENVFLNSIPTSGDFEKVELMRSATIFSYNPKSKGANAFRKLAVEFLTFF